MGPKYTLLIENHMFTLLTIFPLLHLLCIVAPQSRKKAIKDGVTFQVNTITCINSVMSQSGTQEGLSQWK